MLFQKTLDKVLKQQKTATRRIVKAGQTLRLIEAPFGGYKSVSVQSPSGHPLYRVGSSYAVQPSRTAKGIARISITDIKREDVRYISKTDACCEGFESIDEFLMVWCGMHDPQAIKLWTANKTSSLYRVVMDRPKERYTAWALTFALVTDVTP